MLQSHGVLFIRHSHEKLGLSSIRVWICLFTAKFPDVHQHDQFNSSHRGKGKSVPGCHDPAIYVCLAFGITIWLIHWCCMR